MRWQRIQQEHTEVRSPTGRRERRRQDIACLKTKLPWRGVSFIVLMNILIASRTFGSDIAPPSPAKPWSPPGLNVYERELAQGHFNEQNAKEVEINPEKIYKLPEL